MAEQIAFVLLVIFSFSVANVIDPYDLGDEAAEKLEELSTIVEDRIELSEDDIQDLYNDFRQYAKDEIYDGNLEMQQQQANVEAQMDQIKNLAQSAGNDISSCLQDEELQEIFTNYNTKLTNCVADILTEGQRVNKNGKYFVDIVFNKVKNLGSQLGSCNGELLCISPLLTQIETDKVDLIQDIRIQVSATDDLLATLKTLSKTCHEDNASAYISETNIILQQISNCAKTFMR